jgi:hypothetical protein
MQINQLGLNVNALCMHAKQTYHAAPHLQVCMPADSDSAPLVHHVAQLPVLHVRRVVALDLMLGAAPHMPLTPCTPPLLQQQQQQQSLNDSMAAAALSTPPPCLVHILQTTLPGLVKHVSTTGCQEVVQHGWHRDVTSKAEQWKV